MTPPENPDDPGADELEPAYGDAWKFAIRQSTAAGWISQKMEDPFKLEQTRYDAGEKVTVRYDIIAGQTTLCREKLKR